MTEHPSAPAAPAAPDSNPWVPEDLASAEAARASAAPAASSDWEPAAKEPAVVASLPVSMVRRSRRRQIVAISTGLLLVAGGVAVAANGGLDRLRGGSDTGAPARAAVGTVAPPAASPAATVDPAAAAEAAERADSRALRAARDDHNDEALKVFTTARARRRNAAKRAAGKPSTPAATTAPRQVARSRTRTQTPTQTKTKPQVKSTPAPIQTPRPQRTPEGDPDGRQPVTDG